MILNLILSMWENFTLTSLCYVMVQFEQLETKVWVVYSDVKFYNEQQTIPK